MNATAAYQTHSETWWWEYSCLGLLCLHWRIPALNWLKQPSILQRCAFVMIFTEKDSYCSNNDHKNTSKLGENYLTTKEALTVMEFPPQSPELDPIEHLWGHLKTKKAKRSVTSQEALWIIVKSCWDNGSSCFTQACGVHAHWGFCAVE